MSMYKIFEMKNSILNVKIKMKYLLILLLILFLIMFVVIVLGSNGSNIRLADCCDNVGTDKNTFHSYLDVYEQLFSRRRESARYVLEVGIGPPPENGGSIKMWAKYFPNAQIHAMDIIPIEQVSCREIILHPRVFLHTSVDAYDPLIVTNKFTSKSLKFDILIDDGPHTLESMVQFLKLYLPLLADKGVLVIEDIQEMDWINELKAVVPRDQQSLIKVFDRRNVKGRYDDIMFVIDRA